MLTLEEMEQGDWLCINMDKHAKVSIFDTGCNPNVVIDSQDTTDLDWAYLIAFKFK